MIRIYDALMFAKASMAHPRMDKTRQYYEIAIRFEKLANDKQLMKDLRKIIEERKK
jgi:hypothetical protein